MRPLSYMPLRAQEPRKLACSVVTELARAIASTRPSRRLVQELRPEVVIVEEAAEVLEAPGSAQSMRMKSRSLHGVCFRFLSARRTAQGRGNGGQTSCKQAHECLHLFIHFHLGKESVGTRVKGRAGWTENVVYFLGGCTQVRVHLRMYTM